MAIEKGKVPQLSLAADFNGHLYIQMRTKRELRLDLEHCLFSSLLPTEPHFPLALSPSRSLNYRQVYLKGLFLKTAVSSAVWPDNDIVSVHLLQRGWEAFCNIGQRACPVLQVGFFHLTNAHLSSC